MEIVIRNMKVYENTVTNDRKTKLNFLRDIVKNIPFRSPFEGVDLVRLTFH